MEEIWKDVPEYEGLYQVSNFGRVKRITTNKILKLNKRGFHYLGASLCKNGVVKPIYIHHLVAKAFLNHKSCGHKLVIDHINNDPSDNRVENLQIVTQRFNARKNQSCYSYSSQYKGVYWAKHRKKWAAQIDIKRKRKFLGYFECELTAHQAYENAVKNLEQ
jgi:hypothetical protein